MLQNVRSTAFTVSELLTANPQWLEIPTRIQISIESGTLLCFPSLRMSLF